MLVSSVPIDDSAGQQQLLEQELRKVAEKRFLHPLDTEANDALTAQAIGLESFLRIHNHLSAEKAEALVEKLVTEYEVAFGERHQQNGYAHG